MTIKEKRAAFVDSVGHNRLFSVFKVSAAGMAFRSQVSTDGRWWPDVIEVVVALNNIKKKTFNVGNYYKFSELFFYYGRVILNQEVIQEINLKNEKPNLSQTTIER